MTLVRDTDTRRHELHGFVFRPLATPSLGSTELAVWGIDAPAGAASPRHRMSRDEVFVVQTGKLVVMVAGERVELGAGDALTVPAGSDVEIGNPYDVPARAIACTTAGMLATIGDTTIAPPWAA